MIEESFIFNKNHHLMKTRLLTLIWIVCFLLSCQKENTIDSYLGFDGIAKDELDSFLNKKVKDLKIPGMSIAFINHGEVVHHRVMGYASKEQELPVTNTTIFEAASLSKPVFAYFVMKYVDEGKLDLDKPLYEYLPYEDIAYDERYKQITARMVLSHSSGFPNWRNNHPENKLFIKFDPGTDYMYSGEGYMYLSKVLKHIDQTNLKISQVYPCAVGCNLAPPRFG